MYICAKLWHIKKWFDMLKDLTPTQQAAIYYHVYSGCNDWKILYQIAEGEDRYNKLTDSSKRETVSRFKRSDKIQQGIQELIYIKGIQEKENTERIKRELITEAHNSQNPENLNNFVNFLNPDEFLKFASQKANEIQDEKDRREYLKMIANLMNYKDSDREETEIQRFYTPVNCLECEIYKKCGSCSGCGSSC